MRFNRLRAAAAVALPALLVGFSSAFASEPAAKPVCAPWVTQPDDANPNADPVNLGCKNAMNLREMVRDKADLQQGKSLGPSDAEHEGQAVKRYEEGKVKAPASSGGGVGSVFLSGAASSTGGTQ